MPFAQVIEPAVISARLRKEFIQLRLVTGWIANKTGFRSSSALDGYFHHTERFVEDVLAHQQPTDFPFSGSAKLTSKAFQYLGR